MIRPTGLFPKIITLLASCFVAPAFASFSIDLLVTQSDSPDPVVAGTELVYTITVKNDGVDFAENTIAVDVLPLGVTLISDTGSCVEAPVGTLTCPLGTLEGAL